MTNDIIIGRDESDKKNFGDKGLIYIGKHYVKMGQTTSLSNRVLIDVARPHVILISGKRGCLSKDTKIFTNHGFKEIKDFDEKKDKILSFNKKEKIFEWEDAKLIRYDISNEKLINIQLKDGRSITMTKEHPILLEYGKYLFWKEGKEIKDNDKIVSVTKVPEVKNDKESVRIARLLGFILADGNINIRTGRFKDGKGYWYNGRKARIRIFDSCNEVLETAKNDFEEEFGIYAKRYKRKDCNCEVIQVLNQKVVDKFIEFGIPPGNKSATIKVPMIVFESSNAFKANFISALFCCDGYIHKEGSSLDYSCKSKEFLLDLQLLLKHFEIESVIRRKIFKLKEKSYLSYRLFITDNYSIRKFQEQIKLFPKFKIDRLMKHKFVDTNTRKIKTRYISPELYCPKISNISEVDNISEVFDLQVPKNNSFIANGIISHNSGKSSSIGVIAEEMSMLPKEIAEQLCVVIFDTMGIFWTMKFPNKREEDLLNEWHLKTRAFDVSIYCPAGYFKDFKKYNIPVDVPFTIKTSELNAEDWCNVFDIEITSNIGILIERALSSIKEKYDIDDVINIIKKDKKSDENTKNAVENRFNSVKSWGLFDENGTEINKIVRPGRVSIIDLSTYTHLSGGSNIKSLVISIISKKLLNDRIKARKIEELGDIEKSSILFIEEEQEKKDMPLVWFMVDEAHEFLPREKKTPATDALVQLLREGRQPGISLILATQQPGEIHRDVITQTDIVISHRLTAKIDVNALNAMSQSYLVADIQRYLNELPSLKGSAIVLDDNSERIYPVRIRPRISWHGGETPSAIYIKNKKLVSLGP